MKNQMWESSLACKKPLLWERENSSGHVSVEQEVSDDR